MERRYDWVVFDLDGTLLDTLRDVADACNAVLSDHGFPTHPVWDYRYFIGNGAETLLRRTLPRGTDGGLMARALGEYRERYKAHALDTTCAYLNLPAVLERLQTAGVRLAVLSKKDQGDVENVIARLCPPVFTAVRGGRRGVPYKPDPTALNALLDDLGADKGRTLFVGDSGVDMETAKNAGVASCGVLWGFREREELAAAGAEHIVRAPEELAQIVWGDGEG